MRGGARLNKAKQKQKQNKTKTNKTKQKKRKSKLIVIQYETRGTRRFQSVPELCLCDSRTSTSEFNKCECQKKQSNKTK